MRANEFAKTKLKVYQAKIKLKQPGSSVLIDVTVNARNSDMARKLLRQLYGQTSLVSNVKEIRMR